MPTAPDLQNRMKFRHFLNVLQNSWNLQKFLESPPETCMWNLKQFGEVTIFDGKMPTEQDETLTFSQCSPKFMKLTEVIGITTRNMHVKFEAVLRSYNFDGKMPTAPDLQNRMKFWHFLNVLQNSWHFVNSLESPLETSMWNLRQFGEVPIFDGKCRPSKQDKILTFFQYSPKFIKLTEVIGITTRNMHVKFEAVRRSYNFWRKNAYSARPSKQDEILTFSQCSPKSMKLTEVIGITTRNMYVKFEAVWRSYNFWRKNAYSADHPNRIKFWHFLNDLQNPWNLQKLLESPPETCMWNLRQFGEVTIFDRKCRQRLTLETGWNFDFFSMFSKIHDTYRIYWNHH